MACFFSVKFNKPGVAHGKRPHCRHLQAFKTTAVFDVEAWHLLQYGGLEQDGPKHLVSGWD